MPATGMEFGLLGPLLVRRDGEVLPVTPGKQQVVLAMLLLRAGRLVGGDELIEALWGSEPPPSARVSLQNYVVRLRKALGDGQSLIVTEAGGYRIVTEPDSLDLIRFEAALTAGRAAARAGSWAQASGELGASLELWRGRPLAGVDSEYLVAAEVPRLEELHWQAVESRIEADLQLGRTGEVIAELRRLTAAEPLRERLHALLMTALYRDGQQAGALAAYQAARTVLADELGAEPGPELRRLHQELLSGGAALPADPYPGAAGYSGPASPSGAPDSASPGRAGPGRAGGLGPGSAEPGSAEPGSAEPGSAEPGSAEPGRPGPVRRHHRTRTRVLAAAASLLAIGAALAGWRMSAGSAPPSSAAASRQVAGGLAAGTGVPRQYRTMITRAARLCSAPQVTPALIAGVLRVESNFSPRFASPATVSYGIAGWTPSVFRSWESGPQDSYLRPADAIPAVSRYLCWLDQRFDQAGLHSDRAELLAAGYDTSSRSVIDCRCVPPEASGFAASVTRFARQYTAPPARRAT